jgi:hypothetical protein
LIGNVGFFLESLRLLYFYNLQDCVAHGVAEMARYGYGQLSKPKREIRLLILRGNDFDSTSGEAIVLGSMPTVSLNDNPSYYALSYAWAVEAYRNTSDRPVVHTNY